MTTTSMTKTIFLSAKPETVWDYLTDKDKLGEWFHPAENTLAENAEYALTGENHDQTPNKICWGEVTLWNPHQELGYTFTIGPLAGISTKVHWTLEAVGESTRLTLIHSDLPADSQDVIGIAHALDNGWDKHFAKLRESAA